MQTLLPFTRRAATALLLGLALTRPAAAQQSIGAGLTTSVGPLTRAAAGVQTIGQSFTVPPFVTDLSSFRLSLTSAFNGGALRFDAYLYAFNAAEQRITGSALWSQLGVAGSGNEFDFDARTFATGNVTLTSGATYLFLLTTANQGAGVPEDAGNLLGASAADAYAGGSLWVSANGASVAALSNPGAFSRVDGVADAAFTATFVTPEPGSVVLLAGGLVVLSAGAARRRRAARGSRCQRS